MMRRLMVGIVAGIAVLMCAWVFWSVEREPNDSISQDAVSAATAELESGALRETGTRKEKSGDLPSAERRVAGNSQIHVVVADSGNHRFSGAGVSCSMATKVLVVGETDDLGECVLEIPSEAWGTDVVISASHQSYTDAHATVSIDGDVEVSLTLHAIGEISGRVVDESGVPVGEGVAVLLWESWAQTQQPVNFHEDADGANQWNTTTDGDGRFSIVGLDSGRKYLLGAAGQGRATSRLSAVIAGAEPDERMEVTVSQLFGAILVLKDGQGGDLVDCPGYFDLRGNFTRRISTGIKPCSVPRVLIELAGFIQIAPTAKGIARREYLYFATEHSSRVDLEVGVHLPGFEAAVIEVSASQVDVEIPTYHVDLNATAEAWGDLVVVFEGVHESKDTGRAGPIGELRLSGEEDLVYFLTAPRRESHRIVGVPAGIYSARYFEHFGDRRFPAAGIAPLAVKVGEQPAEIIVPMSGTRSVELQLTSSDKSQYLDSLTVKLLPADLDAQGGVQVHKTLRADGRMATRQVGKITFFDRAPYRLDGLAPGVYILDVSTAGSGSVRIPAVVEATTDLVVHSDLERG